MSASTALDEIERYLDSLETGLQAGDPAALELEPPQLRGELELTDAARANALFARLQVLHDRAEGQRVRLAGEIADLRRRSANTGHRRAPSSFDHHV